MLVSSIGIAGIVFACTFAATLGGMAMSKVLPQGHLSKESKDAVMAGMGMLATTTALVLGLMIASAKGAFDAQDNAVKQAAADILTLDRVLARYGPETKEAREQLRRAVAFRIATTWPEGGSGRGRLDTNESAPAGEAAENLILGLSPKTEAQRRLRTQALDLSARVLRTRWLVLGEAGSSIPRPFLVVVVCWVTVIFGSFALFAPRNATVITILLICALSVAASIFLIMEMDRPFEGVIRVSGAPFEYMYGHLGR